MFLPKYKWCSDIAGYFILYYDHRVATCSTIWTCITKKQIFGLNHCLWSGSVIHKIYTSEALLGFFYSLQAHLMGTLIFIVIMLSSFKDGDVGNV